VLLAMILLIGGCSAPPLRLHIVAHSDSETDQQIKLKVRDSVLAAAQEGIGACKTAEQAEEYIRENLQILVEAANETLKDEGVDYSAGAELGSYHFPDRSYGGVTYPEGDYRALRILLGDAQGGNWWCVMFPPLCLNEIAPEGEGDTEYTSLIAEWFRTLFGP